LEGLTGLAKRVVTSRAVMVVYVTCLFQNSARDAVRRREPEHDNSSIKHFLFTGLE